VSAEHISDPRSLDFVINRLLHMKLFMTSVNDTEEVCQDYFDFDLASITTEKRRKTFLEHLDTLGKLAI